MVGQLGAGNAEYFAEMCVFMEKHELHPQIAQTFEFEQANEALEAMIKLSAPGKIVVKV